MSKLTRRELMSGCAGTAGLLLIRKASAAPDVEDAAGRLYTRIASSPVTTAGGADFRVETEDRWDSMNLSVYPVCLRLRITNRSEHPLLFPFFDTFYPVFYNPDKTVHELDGGRDGTRAVMRPLLLEPGEDFSIVPTVQLHWNRGTQELRVVYEDGTGTILRTGPLADGRYSAGFTYSVSERWLNGISGYIPDGAAVWQGGITTSPVPFEIASTR